MTPYLTIGTRGSPLALAQTHMVAAALRRAHGWSEDALAIVPIRTSGDRIQDRPLAELGGKALWTKELDAAMRDGRIDIAVHSMKDVETVRPPELAIVAMLPREDVRDRLVGAPRIADLPRGARVGTSSPRRAAQLLALRPDLRISSIRGNVATRLGKLADGEFDATLLAAAGLKRLGQGDVGSPIEIDEMLPAPAQGAVGIEARSDDSRARGWLAAISDPVTYAAVMAERALLAALGGTCHSPIAALAEVNGDAISIRGEILLSDGSERVADQLSASVENAADAAVTLAERLLGRASPKLCALFGQS